MDDNYVRALLHERAGLERRGLADRVKQVDAELKRVGYDPPREATAPPKRTTAARSRKG